MMLRAARCLIVLCAMVLVGVPMAAAQPQVAPADVVMYFAPTTAVIVDHFRPPAHIGARGNRGLQYGNDDVFVAAAADGIVTFAGSIGADYYITVEHGDGLRTTYSFLAEVWVVEGQEVTAGLGIAMAGAEGLHFGVRLGSHYLDPEVLLEASVATTRLVLSPPR